MDVKALFGAESVKDTQNIDMVINLEDWDKDKEYDRMGLDESVYRIPWKQGGLPLISPFVLAGTWR